LPLHFCPLLLFLCCCFLCCHRLRLEPQHAKIFLLHCSHSLHFRYRSFLV
jgi:hypothetical protein